MKLFIATPTYDGKVCVQYLHSLLRTLNACDRAGLPTLTDVDQGPGYIAWARNCCVRRFLASDATHLLFIDADLCWDPEAVLKIMLRPEPFVVGLYPFKQLPESYPVQVMCDDRHRPLTGPGGIVRISHAPTGFMRLSREVFERIGDAGLAPEYDDPKDAEAPPDREWFACTLTGSTYWGEDFAFCNKWTGLGGEIWAVPDIDFHHYGHSAWSGNWHQFMLRQPGGSEAGSGHLQAAE